MLHRTGIARNSLMERAVCVVALLALLVTVSVSIWLSALSQSAQSAGAEAVSVTSEDVPLSALPTSCPPSWAVISSPNPSFTTNYLYGVAAISPNDVWAVGGYNIGNGVYRSLTLHWNGTQWTQIPSPSPGTAIDALLDVEATSTNDVWAVGYTHNNGGPWLTLTEHWDGTQWSVVPSPNVDPTEDNLYGVSAIASNDVWAVGYYLEYIGGQGFRRTLIEHWDGTQWSVIPSPNVGTGSNQLNSVSALSPTDVWAVGSGSGALVEHWNGSQWSIVPNSNPPGTRLSNLEAVSAISSNDVWAVGRWEDGTYDHTLMKHWDGTQWSVVPSPDAGLDTNWLYDVTAVSSTDAWSVGYFCCGSNGLITLVEHWDGTQWSIISSPNPSRNNNYLSAVAAISSDDVWAVGYYGPSWRTLIEHYAPPNTCLTPSPSPAPSYTITATITPTPTYPSIPTLTATPTVQPALVGHVHWESRPAQPNPLQILPITLTLRSSTTQVNYPAQLTDQYGFVTVAIGSLPSGTYAWRADDAPSEQHPPNYLANSGQVKLTGAATTNVEVGLMRAGDASNDNLISVADFTILKVSFGFACGNTAFDSRADFTGDCLVSIADFNPLKRNFGQSGAPPISPGEVPKLTR